MKDTDNLAALDVAHLAERRAEVRAVVLDGEDSSLDVEERDLFRAHLAAELLARRQVAQCRHFYPTLHVPLSRISAASAPGMNRVAPAVEQRPHAQELLV